MRPEYLGKLLMVTPVQRILLSQRVVFKYLPLHEHQCQSDGECGDGYLIITRKNSGDATASDDKPNAILNMPLPSLPNKKITKIIVI
jgi:hypothetical protein